MKRFLGLFIACLIGLAASADARLTVTNLHMGKPAAVAGTDFTVSGQHQSKHRRDCTFIHQL